MCYMVLKVQRNVRFDSEWPALETDMDGSLKFHALCIAGFLMAFRA